MKKNILVIAIALILILIIGGFLLYSGLNRGPKPAAVPPDNLNKASVTENKINTENKTTDDVVGSAAKGVLPDIQTNPLDDKPDLNPIDKTNPYKNIKTNPFK